MRCKANSCPLSVVYVTNWEKGDDGQSRPKWGVCQYHKMSHPDQWMQTTLNIRKIEGRILTLGIIRDWQTDHTENSPHPGETATAWLERIEQNCRNEITGPAIDGVDAFREVIARLAP